MNAFRPLRRLVLPPLPGTGEGWGEGARLVTVLLTVCFAAWTTAALAAPALSPPTSAEIDRLRMHADAGRDGRALDALRTHARAGLADAQRATGEALVRVSGREHVREGLMWLERAAAQGDVRAMLSIGKLWLLGAQDFAPNAEKARTWFERAAPDSNPQAAYYLGVIAKSSYDKAPDHTQALKHFQFAAQQGIAEAMYLLGNAHANGEGTDIDTREAMRWYLRAAALDHPQAIQELAYAFARGDTLLPQSDLQAANMLRAVEHALRHPKSAP